jgi:hypothetical protein
LRPGPYICGEHEWGGFPAWLSEIPGMVVRTNNTPFLEETEKYVVNLAKNSGLADLQVSRGGPILMVQVENEYGSFGENHNYTEALRDILRGSFEVPLYTNDGGVDWTLEGGQIPTVLAEVDGGSWALPARDLYVTDPTELGPLLDGGEYLLHFPYYAIISPMTHCSLAKNITLGHQTNGDHTILIILRLAVTMT